MRFAVAFRTSPVLLDRPEREGQLGITPLVKCFQLGRRRRVGRTEAEPVTDLRESGHDRPDA
jgi:hypothetical protein